MAAGNVKAGFCLPCGVNEDFIRGLIWQHQQQQQNQKKYHLTTTTKYQPIHIRKCFEIYTG